MNVNEKRIQPYEKQVSVIVKGVLLPGQGIAETPPRVKRKAPPRRLPPRRRWSEV